MTVRRLVLLRHAKSSWEHDLVDVERPLNARGRRDADAVGRWLVRHAGPLDLVLCSTAVRTRETWARAAAAAEGSFEQVPVRFVEAVYQATSATLLGLVQALPDGAATVLVVGHAPGLPDLAGLLDAGRGPRALGEFPTSALALLDLPGSWSEAGPRVAGLTAYEVLRG